MQKPLDFSNRKGLAVNQFNRILTQVTPQNQASRISELSNYISRRHLTDALEVLEKSSVTGDLAIFMLANLQSLEVSS